MFAAHADRHIVVMYVHSRAWKCMTLCIKQCVNALQQARTDIVSILCQNLFSLQVLTGNSPIAAWTLFLSPTRDEIVHKCAPSTTRTYCILYLVWQPGVIGNWPKYTISTTSNPQLFYSINTEMISAMSVSFSEGAKNVSFKQVENFKVTISVSSRAMHPAQDPKRMIEPAHDVSEW